MDLLLAGWILFWDIIIVTITVSITHYKLNKAERDALKERDLIEQRFIEQAKAMQVAIETRIDAIEIPKTDLDGIKADLKESLSQSLNAHITGIKKDLNALKESIDKYAESHPSDGGSPDPLGKLIMKYADKMF